jgi:hypothetical protein
LPIGEPFVIVGEHIGGTSTIDASLSRTGKTTTTKDDNYKIENVRSGIIEESPNKDLNFYIKVDDAPDGHNQYEIENVSPVLDGKVMMIVCKATPQTLGHAYRYLVTNISSENKNVIVPEEELIPYFIPPQRGHFSS